MATVPQRTLDWLYRVLTSSNQDPNQAYHDPNRTYNDVAHLLAQYPHFSPRTDVYTHENGASALLLNLFGTLPVSFRGVLYRFPITVWVPTTYPRDPPIVYVTPTKDMFVRPGQHVSGEGRIYHHYLAHWAEASNRSTIVDFLYILREVFAKEPPVTSKQAQISRPIPRQADRPPPAVPPLPPQLARPEPQPNPSPRPAQIPPQLPPKPGKVVEPQAAGEIPVPEKYTEPPPLPPLPDELRDPRRGFVQPPPLPSQASPNHSVSHPAHQPRGSGTLEPPSRFQHGHVPHHPGYQQESLGPTTPTAQSGPPPPPPPQVSVHRSGQPVSYGQPATMQGAAPQHRPIPQGKYPLPSQQPPEPLARHQEPARRKQPAPDLLTSPFDLELPSQALTAAPPPIPPNPEKDFLLKTLSRTLTQTLHDNINKTNSGLQPLNSQSQALQAAITTLKSEIAALNAFHATLQSNTSILQQSLHRADGIIADARARISSSSSTSGPSEEQPSTGRYPSGLPPIDEVLVPPTVVGKQIYDLVADERGIERAIYALQTGLVKGRVGLDTWAKLTRSLAREAFLKKALIRKAGVGMGLSVDARS
ncbi:hypothetical protein D8B26_005006 [Coccidioides posadasii str. Silveira]|uniref:Endosomal sorting complex protein TSG101 n=1 Tax=Coccidioides posadasii (strain RMSCC 757 / Silveira) TaxID=443226 RepID=E9D5G8_COCPS|nr:endosomal sorting complex protein TSG101 [Coccidioides posadasii str. Silveira]QVM10346.1 hypothetical protein D8B26_005006 [Coccidioides posadasii str. Silveira]